MNQKQRNYIVNELKVALEKKFAKIRKDTEVEQYSYKRVIKAIKDGKITQKANPEYDLNFNVRGVLKGDKMTLLIKRSLGHIDDNGYFYVKRGNFIKAIKEISLDSWSLTSSYRSDTNSFISRIKEEASDVKAVDKAIGSRAKERAERINKAKEAYKEVERNTMLANSEEMIESIKKFEDMEF